MGDIVVKSLAGGDWIATMSDMPGVGAYGGTAIEAIFYLRQGVDQLLDASFKRALNEHSTPLRDEKGVPIDHRYSAHPVRDRWRFKCSCGGIGRLRGTAAEALGDGDRHFLERRRGARAA